MDFQEWLKQWVSRHPAKTISSQERVSYTEQVMKRVKEIASPQAVPARAGSPFSWWRPVLAFSAAAAVVLMVVSRVQQPASIVEETITEPRLVQTVRIEQSVPASEVIPTSPDSFMVAEDLTSDEAWLKETLSLLESLDEDFSDDTYDGWSDEDWMDEIEILDGDFFTSS